MEDGIKQAEHRSKHTSMSKCRSKHINMEECESKHKSMYGCESKHKTWQKAMGTQIQAKHNHRHGIKHVST